jgi:hypothetical protein
METLQFIATLATALFAGAAVYISVVEHPARLGLDTRAALLAWAPSYRRATWMQAPLVLVGCAAGVGAWAEGAAAVWAVAALLIGAAVPFTLLVIMPTNRALLAPGRDPDAAETRALLVRWGQLHALRTVLSLFAAALMVWDLLGP